MRKLSLTLVVTALAASPAFAAEVPAEAPAASSAPAPSSPPPQAAPEPPAAPAAKPDKPAPNEAPPPLAGPPPAPPQQAAAAPAQAPASPAAPPVAQPQAPAAQNPPVASGPAQASPQAAAPACRWVYTGQYGWSGRPTRSSTATSRRRGILGCTSTTRPTDGAGRRRPGFTAGARGLIGGHGAALTSSGTAGPGSTVGATAAVMGTAATDERLQKRLSWSGARSPGTAASSGAELSSRAPRPCRSQALRKRRSSASRLVASPSSLRENRRS